MSSGMIVYAFSPQFDELRRFYEAATGVEGESGGPNWVAFPLGASKLALHRQLPGEPQDPTRFRLDLLVDDIEEALPRVRAAGAELVQGIQDEAFGKSAVLRDPEGREFMLIQEESA